MNRHVRHEKASLKSQLAELDGITSSLAGVRDVETKEMLAEKLE